MLGSWQQHAPRRSASAISVRHSPSTTTPTHRTRSVQPSAEMARLRRQARSTARKSNMNHKMDPKKKILDYTDVAYRDAVNRLKYLLAESYTPRGTSPATKLHYHVHTTNPNVSLTSPRELGDNDMNNKRYLYRPSTRRGLYPVATDTSPSRLSTSFRAYSTLPSYPYKHIPSVLKSSDDLKDIGKGGQHPPGPLTETGNMDTNLEGNNNLPPPELMAFIERQEEYIEQLEKESQYCRDELSTLITKVKEVVTENEHLHDKEKSGLLKSVFDCFEPEITEDDDEDAESDTKSEPKKKSLTKSPSRSKPKLEGPSIVYESRISELEAQLTQTRIALRHAQNDNELNKKSNLEGILPLSSTTTNKTLPADASLLETLQKERIELTEKIAKLQATLNESREKESEATTKVKRMQDAMEQANFERSQADLESRRLQDELLRAQSRWRETLQDQGRKLQEERSDAERRNAQQMEALNGELAAQWEAAGKAQLALDKQSRVEGQLRRELQHRTAMTEEVTRELQSKIASVQAENSRLAAEKASIEHDLASSRLQIDRVEREGRQESQRLQTELQALKQRLDRSDTDLLHARRENLRLNERLAAAEREVTLAKLGKESDLEAKEKSSMGGGGDGAGSNDTTAADREQKLTSMIRDMETRHAQTVSELETMILSQNGVVANLTNECKSLTERLQEASERHKREKVKMREESSELMSKLEQVWLRFKELQKHCTFLNSYLNSIAKVGWFCTGQQLASGCCPVRTCAGLRIAQDSSELYSNATGDSNNSNHNSLSLHYNNSSSSSSKTNNNDINNKSRSQPTTPDHQPTITLNSRMPISPRMILPSLNINNPKSMEVKKDSMIMNNNSMMNKEIPSMASMTSLTPTTTTTTMHNIWSTQTTMKPIPPNQLTNWTQVSNNIRTTNSNIPLKVPPKLSVKWQLEQPLSLVDLNSSTPPKLTLEDLATD